MLKLNTFLVAGLIICTLSCKKDTREAASANESIPRMEESIQVDSFGVMPSGKLVGRYTLTNKNGLQMQVINFGGIITSLKVPDKNGNLEDVVLGFDSLQHYLNGSPFFGALVGRYGNRIAKGKFVLDGKEYTLAQNNNGNHLHGGLIGFDKVYWNIEPATDGEGPAIKLTYISKDMEEGYPGNLSVEVSYTLSNNDELKIDYKATTDKKTIINLTNHTYFNLTGDAKRDILDHQVMINADKFVPIDEQLIPLGMLRDVKGTPFDFSSPTTISTRIDEDDPQIKNGMGYDHCWVISPASDSLRLGVTVYEPVSGRYMEMYTTQPGVQFYTGNFLNGSAVGKGGVVYERRYGLCLETEHFPDSPNQSSFPSVELDPGEIYHTQTTYAFSVK
jgi:aldose 1-epimerase